MTLDFTKVSKFIVLVLIYVSAVTPIHGEPLTKSSPHIILAQSSWNTGVPAEPLDFSAYGTRAGTTNEDLLTFVPKRGIRCFENTIRFLEDECYAWYYNITFRQITAFWGLLAILWSYIIAISYMKNPRKHTFKNVFMVQLYGFVPYPIILSIQTNDMTNLTLLFSWTIWFPLVMLLAWVSLKIYKIILPLIKKITDAYQNLPD